MELKGLPSISDLSANLRDGRARHGFLLATDLDGTFLEGSVEVRYALSNALKDRASGSTLIFVTGRGLETITPLLSDPLVPTPDFVIADVGATVVRGPRMLPVHPIQGRIASKWPGESAVMRRLRSVSGLVRQDVPQERRCSFFADDLPGVRAELEAAARELGCDLLVSADKYIDFLPAGVSKGSTLLALLQALGIQRDHVAVAGDTLNDLSLFSTGLPGIVVSNAELSLVKETLANPNVFFARSPGAAGVLEGLIHYGFIEQSEDQIARDTEKKSATVDDLIMVYHRLPFEEYQRSGKTYRRPHKSPNGILPSLLSFFSRERPGAWVGWTIQESRTPSGFESRSKLDATHPNLSIVRVPLTQSDVDVFYKRFSKEAFWPIVFSFPSKARFHADQWELLLEVNRAFAEHASAAAPSGALVWIHDYNLWMVPAFLRQNRPDLRIAFFHHTAFPHSDIFNMLPWRREIVGSLTSCDYVGFHIPRYAENFVDVVRSNMPTRITRTAACAPRFLTYGCALGIDTMTAEVEVHGRTVGVGAHPIGIDPAKIKTILSDARTQKKIGDIRNELRGRQCILSVERLDYVKGPIEKVEAFEELLAAHPELHGKVVLINIVTPPAPGMEAYRSTGDRVDQSVGRVNGRFGTLDWTPIRYFYRALPFEDVVAYYAASDVAWITPLRDGLNLVAKEFVAAKAAAGSDGVLILSEFAGAAVELHGAVLTNPSDPINMVDVLKHSLIMDPVERSDRMRRMSEIVMQYDVQAWGEDFINAAGARR